MQSTPICALQAACNEMPLHLRHYYLCLGFKAKLLRLPPNGHPALSLIEYSGVEVYGVTEKILSEFNLPTKSPVFLWNYDRTLTPITKNTLASTTGYSRYRANVVLIEN